MLHGQPPVLLVHRGASSPTGSLLLTLLGIVVPDAAVLLGIDCSPISVVGVGGGTCSANAVCCSNNSAGNLISVGCIPIILQLRERPPDSWHLRLIVGLAGYPGECYV
ncbi:hypothetical protein LXA43DRAFT_1088307 [Ganoderma leucocontextum]|nr:hypothetical protein LXA43DRAFT_1088307 [Ganoderma leucocontextum]